MILRKLAASPRQNELAAALREVGRIERSLFMIDWKGTDQIRVEIHANGSAGGLGCS